MHSPSAHWALAVQTPPRGVPVMATSSDGVTLASVALATSGSVVLPSRVYGTSDTTLASAEGGGLPASGGGGGVEPARLQRPPLVAVTV